MNKSIFCAFLLGWQLGIPAICQQHPLDSLRSELATMQKDTQMVWVLRDIAYFHRSDNLDSALFYSDKAIRLSRELNFVSGEIWSLYQKALALEFSDKFESAIEVYDLALSLASSDPLSLAKLHNAKGAAYYYQGNHLEALFQYQRALHISDSISYPAGQSHALNNLGIIYRSRKNYIKAIEAYENSLALKTHMNDTVGLVNTHYNLGVLFGLQQEPKKSLSQFQTAAQLFGKRKISPEYASIEAGLGVAHYHLGDYEAAERYLNQAKKNLLKEQVHEALSVKAYLGCLFVRKYQNPAGLIPLQEALKTAREGGRLELAKDISKELAQVFELLGREQDALATWKRYDRIRDSLFQDQKEWAFQEMQARFEAIEKEKLIARQSALLIKEKKASRGIMISGFLLGVIVFGTWFFKKKTATIMPVTNKQQRIDSPTPTDGFKPLNLERVNKRLLSPLTQREWEIVLLVDEGLSNHKIAQRLFVSENTVKTHLKNIYSKTEVNNRTSLVYRLRR